MPFLWRFHRVHHNDPTMDVTTASRFHTGEIAISSTLRIGVILLLGIARSFRLRDDPSTIELGLHGWDAPEDQRFTGLLWAPLKKTGIASVEADSATQGQK